MSTLDLSSFPPLFRQPNSNSNPNPNTNTNTNPVNMIIESNDSHQPSLDSDVIPIIDFQHLNPDKLGEVCRNWGIFRLVNHGIPINLWNQLEEQSRKMFSLPFETKQTQFTDPIAYFWGTPALTTKGVAITKSVQNINWVEGFNVPLGLRGGQQSLQFHREEDSMLDSFRCLLEEYGRHMARLVRSLFEVLLINLGLDSSLSMPYMSESTGMFRVYRYPHCLQANQIYGMHAHTDSAVLAILNQDLVGGLQVLKEDKWFDVKPVPDMLVVNLGDMMQAMSNDEYKSVKHRVKVNRCEERISIGYFVFPEDHSVIQSSKYKPFTYEEFRAQVQEDIKTTGFKVGLDRFRLSKE